MENILNQFINDPLVNSLKDYLSKEDMLQIIGMERKEVPYTKILEWLFDSRRNDGFAALPVKLFLKMLNVDCWYNVVSCTAKENRYGDNGIPDLWLDCKLSDGTSLSICIENKIYSNTHDSQLARYYDEFKEENAIFCILAVKPEKIKEKHPKYLQVSYQMLMDNVLVPLKNINNDSRIIQLIHAMECPSKSGQEPMAISTQCAQQIEKLLEDYKDFMLNVLKTNHEENDSEILDVVNYMEQDHTSTGRGYYLYLLDGESTDSKKNIIGPFASINSQMLRELAILYIRQYDIVDEKAFLSSPLASVRIGNNLIYSLEYLNTSYYPKTLDISDEKFRDINSKIYVYNQIRTENQKEKLVEAIKSLGFKIIYNI